VNLSATHGRGAVGEELTTDFGHVVRQGKKWDRSDFFMLLPEAGAFNSPRTPAAASGAGFGGE
jgi:hypothetical protein